VGFFESGPFKKYHPPAITATLPSQFWQSQPKAKHIPREHPCSAKSESLHATAQPSYVRDFHRFLQCPTGPEAPATGVPPPFLYRFPL